MRRHPRIDGKRGRTTLLLSCLLGLLPVLSGCHGGSGQVGAGQPSTQVTGLSVSAAAADLERQAQPVGAYPAVPAVAGAAALKGRSVWYIPIGSSIPIAAAVGSSMQSALAAAGVTVHVCDGHLLPNTIASCMSQAVTQHADAVVTGFIDYSLVPTAFDGLVAHHIKVLVAGEAPSGERTSSSQLAFYDATPSFEGAEHLTLESVIADSGAKAKILYVGITNSSLTRNTSQDATAFVARECPGCSLHEIDYATAEVAKLPSRVSAALLQNPDIGYVAVEFDSGDNAVIQGIQAAGYSGKVKLVSASGNLDALERVRAGTQLADVGLSPVYFGWSYADGVIRLLAGQPLQTVSNPARVFTEANAGTLTLTPDSYATNDWYGPNSYQGAFLRAWGLSG